MSELLFEETVKARFCPSPTGMLHLGNVRTALFNWLFSQHYEGSMLLRIEDTDRERSDERYTEALMDDLQWLGINWQEGVGAGGELGPYHQSKRQAIYNDYYDRLEAMKLAYPCFCTEEELTLMRRIQRSQGKPPRYSGKCRQLSEEEVQQKLAEGLKPTLRFRVPENEAVEFEDLVKGAQRILTDDISDFIIRRADGTPPFMFCNAIDDALMEVTHVIRGEDHVTNTPRQILILNALGLNLPHYAHVSLILGNDDSPLSKRNGSQSVEALRQSGYLPNAITNYLARLGHYYGHDDYLELPELAKEFRVAALNKSPAKFNIDQLNYWQKEAVMHLDQAQFFSWLGEEIAEKVPEAARADFFAALQPNVRFPSEALHWVQVLFGDAWLDETKLRSIQQQVKENYFIEATRAVELHGCNLRKMINHLKSTLEVDGKALYQPLRVALTGEFHGPELDKVVLMLPQEEIIKRLQKAGQ